MSCQKGGVFIFYEHALKELRKLEAAIDTIHAELSNLPNGKLVCSRNHTRYKWYQSDGHKKEYIPKANRPLAEQLAAKNYLTAKLKECLCEKRAIELYLKHHSKEAGKSEQFLEEESPYRELLIPFFTPVSEELEAWANAVYERNGNHPEQLIHKTPSGRLVRSKSEAMIEYLLTKNKIPFRYECILYLGEKAFFPDFTIRHPKTGAVYYWEHFGLIDDPVYTQNACSKMRAYAAHGIFPTIHLIMTFETKEYPLAMGTVERLIEDYFL